MAAAVTLLDARSGGRIAVGGRGTGARGGAVSRGPSDSSRPPTHVRYFVFDRRSHAVFGLDAELSGSWEIVQIGAEPGRIIDPTAFAVAPDGSFVVADAPNGRERIQIFTAPGLRIGGFLLPGRLKPRVVLGQDADERHRIAAVHRAIAPDVAAGNRRARSRSTR
jgi:DNA-binding beta-propeller fold protein YncE